MGKDNRNTPRQIIGINIVKHIKVLFSGKDYRTFLHMWSTESKNGNHYVQDIELENCSGQEGKLLDLIH